jgi:undecaprenyl-diphosphatase
MEILESIILGAVQGLTEFLPVSSSGHLQLAKALLGVELEENLTFDIALHAATVLSTIVVLWSEIWWLVKGLFARGMNEEKSYFLKLVLSMIPIGIVGLMLGDYIDAILSSQYVMLVVGGMLLLTAALLTFAYYARPRLKDNISYRDAFIIGVGQAVAAMPGLSRSGTTIATGILLGNKKSVVATFSFLMVLAPIMGQALLDIVDGGFAVAGVGTAPLIAGFVTAFVVGCLACKYMINIVKKGKLIWFAIYCAVVGLIAITTYII